MRLRGRSFIEPQSNLVTKPLIVIFGWQQCILNYLKVDSLCVNGILEVTVKFRLFEIRSPFRNRFALDFITCNLQNFLDAKIKLCILNSVKSNVEFHLKTAFVVKVLSFSHHLQG